MYLNACARAQKLDKLINRPILMIYNAGSRSF